MINLLEKVRSHADDTTDQSRISTHLIATCGRGLHLEFRLDDNTRLLRAVPRVGLLADGCERRFGLQPGIVDFVRSPRWCWRLGSSHDGRRRRRWRGYAIRMIVRNYFRLRPDKGQQNGKEEDAIHKTDADHAE